MTIRLSHASRQNPSTNACVRFNVGHRPDDRSARRRGPIDAMTSRSRTSGDVGGVRRTVAGRGVSRYLGPPVWKALRRAGALGRADLLAAVLDTQCIVSMCTRIPAILRNTAERAADRGRVDSPI